MMGVLLAREARTAEQTIREWIAIGALQRLPKQLRTWLILVSLLMTTIQIYWEEYHRTETETPAGPTTPSSRARHRYLSPRNREDGCLDFAIAK